MPDPMRRDCLDQTLCDMRPDLIKLARLLTRQNDAAQDLTQDVLLRLWLRIREGDDIRDLPAYGRVALRNAYRQSLRNRQRALSMTSQMTEDMGISEPDAFAQIALTELNTAIDRLPAQQAALIRMVAEGDTSPADLARRLGIPKGTVMSRLARARAQLRQEMGLGRRTPVSTLI